MLFLGKQILNIIDNENTIELLKKQNKNLSREIIEFNTKQISSIDEIAKSLGKYYEKTKLKLNEIEQIDESINDIRLQKPLDIIKNNQTLVDLKQHFLNLYYSNQYNI